MLKHQTISDLLSGKLPEDEIRQRLLDLTPDKLDAKTLQKCIDDVREFCAPDFAKLSGLGARGLDCSGTGGSGRPRFNTSTAAAFVISAAKIPVAKFGNRAATSKSGSFDVLQQMGITEKISATTAARILDAVGLVFLFAPQAYPALGVLSSIRVTLGVPTVFNFIGPLLNPVNPAFRVMGVAHPLMRKLVTSALHESSPGNRSVIVRSSCGLDEICPYCSTDVSEIHEGSLSEYTIPGISEPPGCVQDRAYTPTDNAEILARVIQSRDSTSYEYQLVCRNAGAGIYAGGKAKSIDEGIELARQLLRQGEVQNQFDKVRDEYAKHS